MGRHKSKDHVRLNGSGISVKDFLEKITEYSYKGSKMINMPKPLSDGEFRLAYGNLFGINPADIDIKFFGFTGNYGPETKSLYLSGGIDLRLVMDHPDINYDDFVYETKKTHKNLGPSSIKQSVLNNMFNGLTFLTADSSDLLSYNIRIHGEQNIERLLGWHELRGKMQLHKSLVEKVDSSRFETKADKLAYIRMHEDDRDQYKLLIDKVRPEFVNELHEINLMTAQA